MNTQRFSSKAPRSQERARQPNSHGCFICGLDNPSGLKIVFYENSETLQVCADLTVPETFRGYPGAVHGGIVAAILDETAGRALMAHTGDDHTFFVTAKLEVRYRHATPTDTPIVAVGWVERQGENRTRVKGELRLPDGTVLAECESIIVRPPSEFLDCWAEEEPYWRVYGEEELRAKGCRIPQNHSHLV